MIRTGRIRGAIVRTQARAAATRRLRSDATQPFRGAGDGRRVRHPRWHPLCLGVLECQFRASDPFHPARPVDIEPTEGGRPVRNVLRVQCHIHQWDGGSCLDIEHGCPLPDHPMERPHALPRKGDTDGTGTLPGQPHGQFAAPF